MLVPSSRRAVAVLSCSLLVGGLAGCGSSDSSSGSSSTKSASGVDGAALLNDALKKITPDGSPLKSGTLGVTISGTVDAPKDKDLKKLNGKIALTVSADQSKGGSAPLPPTKVTFDVDGTYTTGSGQAGSAKYAGGFSYLDDQLYVNWKGKDYAFGQELTKQFAQGFGQGFTSSFEKRAGNPDTFKKLIADPAKLRDALDLQPGDWITDPKVTDGPELDGVATYAVSGQIDLKAAATDLNEGFKNLPKAFPDLAGIKNLEQSGDVNSAEIAKAEKSLTTRNATVYVGKDDHVQRRILLELAGKDETGDQPMDVDLKLQFDTSKLNQSQGITAPKSAAPVTDLFAELQKDFPGIGGLLGG